MGVMRLVLWMCAVLSGGVSTDPQVAPAIVIVETRAADRPLAGAEVVVNGIVHRTSDAGAVRVSVPPGRIQVVARSDGFLQAETLVELRSGEERTIVLELQPQPTVEEEITVAATRTNKRIEDVPMRVEVLEREEIEEKMLMTPGDIVMMLNEMGGMRVQATSPSLGAASVRIQGMRGRYTRFLSDGLPLFGEQVGVARAAADSADGSRPGGSDQGRGLGALRRRRDGRCRQPGVAAARRRAASARSWSIDRAAARPTRSSGTRRRCRHGGASHCSAAAMAAADRRG